MSLEEWLDSKPDDVAARAVSICQKCKKGEVGSEIKRENIVDGKGEWEVTMPCDCSK